MAGVTGVGIGILRVGTLTEVGILNMLCGCPTSSKQFLQEHLCWAVLSCEAAWCLAEPLN